MALHGTCFGDWSMHFGVIVPIFTLEVDLQWYKVNGSMKKSHQVMVANTVKVDRAYVEHTNYKQRDSGTKLTNSSQSRSSFFFAW